PSGMQLSHMLTFYGLHFDDGTANIRLNEMYIPYSIVSNYIALNTPYVDYTYPNPGGAGGVKRLYGSAVPGYNLEYTFDNVTMDMHGWSWFEVTTKDYQAVAYATRSLEDGYDNYSYKHLTLLDKHNGKVLEEYSTDEITITENDWMHESEFNRKRPNMVTFSTPYLNVTVNASSVVDLNMSRPDQIGFVHFMAFQPENATIQYNGDIETGSAFYEYLVSDWGVIYS
ncbi:MAG: hypothetical protein K0A90_06890, partial [Methanosarcinaceae archaeon]|nr:hypothetical protein [Methanosarcinaceae archaeon]